MRNKNVVKAPRTADRAMTSCRQSPASAAAAQQPQLGRNELMEGEVQRELTD